MRNGFSLVVGLCVLLFSAAAWAQDLPTSHDCGITVTPDDLTASIQESQDFWGPVRKHLAHTDCDLGQVEPRAQATAYLKSIHDALHQQLFGKGEAESRDLIEYLGHRLRMFEVYRRLRTTIADDSILIGLIESWQRSQRDIHLLPAAEQPAKLAALPGLMTQSMQDHGLSGEKLVEASRLWTVQGEVIEKMNATMAGRMMVNFENEAAKLSPQIGEVLLQISDAADWVLITREQGAEIGRTDFITAIGFLREHRAKQSANLGSAINR